MRTFFLITLLFLALLGGGVYLKEFYQPSEAVAPTPLTVTATTAPEKSATPTTPEPDTAEPATGAVSTKPSTAATTPKPVVAVPTPEPVRSVPIATCVEGGVCTQAEVAEHNTRTDCYVSMSNLGKVYNVTEYVRNNTSVHPGGDIADYCGMDIFVSFSGQSGDHRHSGRAMQDLTQYEFANLK